MKQSDKTPFFEKGDGVFVLRWVIKEEGMIVPSQDHLGERGMVSCFRTNIPSNSGNAVNFINPQKELSETY